MRAAISGFVQSHEPELLDPFAAEYFEQAASIWHQRTPETASDLIVGLFPIWPATITEDTLALADAFLADNVTPARRCVGWSSEGRADVARALNARRVDRARGETEPSRLAARSDRPPDPTGSTLC